MSVSGKGARRKGISWERTLLNHLHANQLAATNLNKSGYPGTDIAIELFGHGSPFDVMADAKNVGKLNLAGWVDKVNTDVTEANTQTGGDAVGVIIHKRVRRADPDDAYVTMDLKTFMRILRHIR